MLQNKHRRWSSPEYFPSWWFYIIVSWWLEIYFQQALNPEVILLSDGSPADIYVYCLLSQKCLFAFPNILPGSTREFWMVWKIQEVNWGCQESSSRLIISVDSRRKRSRLAGRVMQVSRWCGHKLNELQIGFQTLLHLKPSKQRDVATDFIINSKNIYHEGREGTKIQHVVVLEMWNSLWHCTPTVVKEMNY